MIKVGVVGALGKMGSQVVKTVIEANNMELAVAVDKFYDLNKTYEAYGRVGDLPIDKVYVGMWNYDEELEDIVIRDVEIDGYVCSGSLTTVDCTKK